jgi:hypothetical protein
MTHPQFRPVPEICHPSGRSRPRKLTEGCQISRVRFAPDGPAGNPQGIDALGLRMVDGGEGSETARDLYERICRPMTMRQIWLVPS